jgi:hypothetical protein
MNPVSLRHQWGPAPSGSSRHVAQCRRCGLREVTDWYDAPGGAVEVTTWVAPGGDVVATRRIDSHQGPPPKRLPELVDSIAEKPPGDVVRSCPGHPLAWQTGSETLEP